MNDHDFDLELEAEVRAELRRSIVPPPASEYVRDRVERLATQAMAEAGRYRSVGAVRLPTSGLRKLVAVVAIVAVAGATLFWLSVQQGSVPVSAPTPSSTPPTAPGTLLHMSVTTDGAGFVYFEGDGLRVTMDHGVTWSEARSVPASDSAQDRIWDVTALDFLDGRHGWMTGVTNNSQGSQVVEYRTGDGGQTWQSAPVASLPPDASPAAHGSFVGARDHFWDALHGRIVVGRIVPNGSEMADCQWYATDDGGVSWSGPTSGSCIGLSPIVNWTTDAIGYSVPADAQTSVSVTQDGGQTWRTAPLPGLSVGTILPEMLIVDGVGHLSLVTSASPSEGPAPQLVFGSSDGGATWSKEFDMTLPAGFDTVDSVSALGPQHWIAVVEVAPGPRTTYTSQAQYGYTRFAETLDGGRTWNLINGGGMQGAGGSLWWDDRRGIVAANETTCPSPGSGYCGSGPPRVFVTDDGGRTWRPVPF